LEYLYSYSDNHGGNHGGNPPAGEVKISKKRIICMKCYERYVETIGYKPFSSMPASSAWILSPLKSKKVIMM
jgi:hypothetical protein